MVYFPTNFPSKSTIHVGKYTIVPWMVMGLWYYESLGGGNPNIFHFHPDPWGNDSQFDEHIFQKGWFNHQLVVVEIRLFFNVFYWYPGSMHRKFVENWWAKLPKKSKNMMKNRETSSPKKTPRKAPGMVAHWWHRPSPEAFHKETGLGVLKGIHLRGKATFSCPHFSSSTEIIWKIFNAPINYDIE